MANYLAALRAFHIIHGMDTTVFKDEHVLLFLKAIRIQAPFRPHSVLPLDITLLERILIACDHFKHPVVFKALYSLTFFSFLKLSNLLPHSLSSYDHTRQMSPGDVFFIEQGAVLLLKWSKTM